MSERVEYAEAGAVSAVAAAAAGGGLELTIAWDGGSVVVEGSEAGLLRVARDIAAAVEGASDSVFEQDGE